MRSPGSPTAEAGDLKSLLIPWFITTCIALCCTFEAKAEYFGPLWPESQPIYYEVQGTPQFKRIVKEACDLISGLSRGSISLKKGMGGILVTRGQITPFWGTCLLTLRGSEITSARVQIASSLRMNKKTENILIRLVVLHELLHAIGLDHSDDPYSIMYPIVNGQSLSTTDIYHIQTLYGGF